MTEPAYPAARLVAPKVEADFAQRAEQMRRRGRPGRGVAPDAATIEAIIDAAFWASLRREEIYVPRFSLALMPPDAASDSLLFERPVPLRPARLVQVAPAVERAGIHLGVWRDASGDGLHVWGTVRAIPPLSIVVEVAAPGLLVIKHHRGDDPGIFVNVAVLEGDQINILVQLAVSMRAHKRGGLLLIVPTGDESWQDSMVTPIPYAVQPAFAELAAPNRAGGDAPDPRVWQNQVNRSVDAIAGRTAVDGATVLTDSCDLGALGAKSARPQGSLQVEQVTATELIEGDVAATVHPNQPGGTRHLCAAPFVHDQRRAVALVAAQDGRFTVFAWSPCENIVHAHRAETLLV